jgi:hypothetical protein
MVERKKINLMEFAKLTGVSVCAPVFLPSSNAYRCDPDFA